MKTDKIICSNCNNNVLVEAGHIAVDCLENKVYGDDILVECPICNSDVMDYSNLCESSDRDVQIGSVGQ